MVEAGSATSPKPQWPKEWEEKSAVLSKLVWPEYLCRWFFYIFKTSALVRFSIELTAFTAVIVGVVGLWLDLVQRDIDRSVRAATLLAQMAQTQSVAKGKSNFAMRASIEALARNKTSMQYMELDDIDLFGAKLVGADFSYTSFVSANFYGANLNGSRLYSAILIDANFETADLRNANLFGASARRADFRSANLRGANLSKANLSGARLGLADLSNANLKDADLSGTNFDSVLGLTQEQLNSACARPGNPPIKLPRTSREEPLTWGGCIMPLRR